MPQAFDPVPPAALTINEASDYARVSRATLYRLIAAPDCPLQTSKIGNRRLVLRSSLDSLIANGAAIPAPPKSEAPPQVATGPARRAPKRRKAPKRGKARAA